VAVGYSVPEHVGIPPEEVVVVVVGFPLPSTPVFGEASFAVELFAGKKF